MSTTNLHLSPGISALELFSDRTREAPLWSECPNAPFCELSCSYSLARFSAWVSTSAQILHHRRSENQRLHACRLASSMLSALKLVFSADCNTNKTKYVVSDANLPTCMYPSNCCQSTFQLSSHYLRSSRTKSRVCNISCSRVHKYHWFRCKHLQLWSYLNLLHKICLVEFDCLMEFIKVSMEIVVLLMA